MNLLDLVSILVGVFVPVFVAMDPVGALPLVVAWTGGLATTTGSASCAMVC